MQKQKLNLKQLFNFPIKSAQNSKIEIYYLIV